MRDRLKRKSVLMRSLLSIAILTPLLIGCNEETFRYLCPELNKYTPEFQAKVAKELATAGPATKQLISDYGKLRDACRALEAPK